MVIELTMQSGTKFYLDPAVLDTFGVKDDPRSYIFSAINGARGGLMTVKSAKELTGANTYINPRLIESVTITE